jgi:putative ubiquitin-RnfH superfamily antitoxin RatB of RatAB toxin-antitoxin module
VGSGRLTVEVVFPLPERQDTVTLDLPAGATVRDALAAFLAGGGDAGPVRTPEQARVARYGRMLGLGDAVADGDRLDILRPLVADPKESRRRRAALQARRKR